MNNVKRPQDLVVAAEGLRRILFETAYADLWLRSLRQKTLKPQELKLIERRVLGTLQYLYFLTALLDRHLNKPLRKLPPIVQVELLLATFRLLFEDRSPTYAVIYPCLNAFEQKQYRWVKPMAHAVLQKIATNAKIDEKTWSLLSATEQAGIPDFWVQALKSVLPPNELELALRKIRDVPTLDFYVLNAELTAETLQQKYHLDVQTTSIQHAYRLAQAQADFWQTNLLATGQVAIQDFGITAWLNMILSTIEPPVWDTCCAPGGKLIFLSQHGIEQLFATDQNPKRLQLVESGLAKLKQTQAGFAKPVLHVANVEQTPWPRNTKFKTILADLPCSASGTLARHPDVVLRTKPEDLLRLQELQLRMLTQIATYADVGATLWYSTCSFFPQENEHVVERFLQQHPQWQHLEVNHPLDHVKTSVVRFWPHRHQTHGFCAIGLKKRASP